MARALSFVLVLAAACARPRHEAAPMPASPAPSVTRPPRITPSIAKVAAFDPVDHGSWAGNLELTPTPASLVAPCLASGATGWVSVDVETQYSAASKTSVLEASPDTSAETRACIAKALTGVHAKLGAIRVLLYVTFSPP